MLSSFFLSSCRSPRPATAARAMMRRRRCVHRRESFLSSSSSSTSTTTSSSATNAIPAPSSRQLRILALRSAIPMVGFGFMDNLVMIQAGEAIDLTIGVAFGLSTMTAAGLGQCVSDVSGLTTGGLVDAAVARLNLPHHGLNAAQLDLRISRLYSTGGGCLGVITGCLLGMTILLFKDTNKAERLKKAKELQSIFESIMDKSHHVIKAERATLWMMDSDNPNELWSRVATGTDQIIKVPSNSGIVGACIQQGTLLNVSNAYKDERFNTEVDKALGYRTDTILALPVRNDEGEVVGAIQMINKKNPDGTPGEFTANDEKLVRMLSSHVTAFIRIVNGD